MAPRKQGVEAVTKDSIAFYGNNTLEGCCLAFRAAVEEPHFDAYHHMWSEEQRESFKEAVQEPRFGMNIFPQDLPLFSPWAPTHR